MGPDWKYEKMPKKFKDKIKYQGQKIQMLHPKLVAKKQTKKELVVQMCTEVQLYG